MSSKFKAVAIITAFSAGWYTARARASQSYCDMAYYELALVSDLVETYRFMHDGELPPEDGWDTALYAHGLSKRPSLEDMWGTPYRLIHGEKYGLGFLVVSAGPDREFRTSDDNDSSGGLQDIDCAPNPSKGCLAASSARKRDAARAQQFLETPPRVQDLHHCRG